MKESPDSDSQGRSNFVDGGSSSSLFWRGLRYALGGASFVMRVGREIDTEIGKTLTRGGYGTRAKSQALSLIGSGGILVCALAPIMNVPVVGAVNYFNVNSEVAWSVGVLLIILGFTSLSVALLEKYAWLYAVGFVAFLIALGTLLACKLYVAKSAGEPSVGFVEYFTQSASKEIAERSSLSFGVLLLIYGAVIVILAAVLRPRIDEL